MQALVLLLEKSELQSSVWLRRSGPVRRIFSTPAFFEALFFFYCLFFLKRKVWSLILSALASDRCVQCIYRFVSVHRILVVTISAQQLQASFSAQINHQKSVTVILPLPKRYLPLLVPVQCLLYSFKGRVQPFGYKVFISSDGAGLTAAV